MEGKHSFLVQGNVIVTPGSSESYLPDQFAGANWTEGYGIRGGFLPVDCTYNPRIIEAMHGLGQKFTIEPKIPRSIHALRENKYSGLIIPMGHGVCDLGTYVRGLYRAKP